MNADVAKFARLNRWAIGLCFLIMCLGSVVRANDAGLSCPDWPLCYGKLVPYFDLKIFLEWFHRLLALIFSLLILRIAVLVGFSASLRKLLSFHLSMIGILLVVQIILGGLTVLQMIDPGVVSAHLINAVLLFAVILAAQVSAEYALGLTRLPKIVSRRDQRFMRTGFTLITSLLFIQIFLGGMVSSNFAGSACPDFPTCFGQWFPSGGKLVFLQMAHRYLGILAAIMIFIFSLILSLGKEPKSYYSHWATRLLPSLVFVQIFLGIYSVAAHLPVWSTSLHLANAIVMFGVSTLACFETWQMDSESKECVANQAQEIML